MLGMKERGEQSIPGVIPSEYGVNDFWWILSFFLSFFSISCHFYGSQTCAYEALDVYSLLFSINVVLKC